MATAIAARTPHTGKEFAQTYKDTELYTGVGYIIVPITYGEGKPYKCKSILQEKYSELYNSVNRCRFLFSTWKPRPGHHIRYEIGCVDRHTTHDTKLAVFIQHTLSERNIHSERNHISAN